MGHGRRLSAVAPFPRDEVITIMVSPRVPAFRPDQTWLHAREPLFWLDPTLRIAWVNKAWESLTGLPAESVVGVACGSHGPIQPGEPTDLAASFSPPPESVAGTPAGGPTLILRADGERVWQRVEFWPVRGQDDALLGILGQVREPDTAPSVPDSTAQELRVRLMQIRDRLHRGYGTDALIGTGPAHARLLEQVRLAASSRVPVLIVGEPGTGKRLVARTIHHLAANGRQPLVPIDCEALPPEVLERELFAPGRQGDPSQVQPPGAASHPPCLSLREGSSLLIGDILALPRDLQARLAVSLDGSVRLIATTAGDPDIALEEERLRLDLYFALTVLVIHLEPLRRRRHDLPTLSQHLLERANQRTGACCGGFSPEASAAIDTYDWPGNMRELARVVDAAHDVALVRARSTTKAGPESPDGSALIERDDLPASIRGNLGSAYNPPPPAAVRPLDELLTEIERRVIESALSRARRNKSRAAELLGISRPRLYRRIKELNLPDNAEAEPAEVNGSP
jgi:DNA-binding NtrC family response regulator